MKSLRIDMSGKKIGRLIVLGYSHTDKKRAYWSCKCNCGNICIVQGKNLRRMNTISCGCYKKEQIMRSITKHGGRHEDLYSVWTGINKRCNNSHCEQYKNYGGRGIKVEWTNYLSFRSDMSESYHDHIKKYGYAQLDRINNNGNYAVANCKWSTRIEQANNKRTNHLMEINGKIQNIKQWSDELNIPYSRIVMRLRRGKTDEQALLI